MNDRHTGPAWNVLMWTLLFLGQGIQVSLYCQEWYARRHCPLPQVRQQPLPSSAERAASSQPFQADSIAVVRDRAWLGEGNSRFRFMCVTRSDLTHNLPFCVTDNILGAGDTSILVLPSLEVNAPHLDDVSSSLPVKPRARAPHRTPLPHLESGTCTQDLPGDHGGSRYTSLWATDHRRSVG